MSTLPVAASDCAQGKPIANSVRLTALALLFLAYVLSFTDRQIVSILFQPIKKEFGLADTQLGLLGGLAFGAFYATLGIPIALMADRGRRREIIAASLATFSAATALCGMALSFPQLFLARIGVGIGEAGVNPASHSILADYFPPERRSTVMSIIAMGASVGTFLGLVIGGFVSHRYGWRMAFVAVGAPGIVLAVAVQLVLREPPRGLSEERTAGAVRPPLFRSLAYFWSNRAMRHLIIASTLTGLANYGISQWRPAFFMRVHGVSASEIGLTLGLMAGILGGTGALCGGWLTDRLQQRRTAWGVWMIGAALVATLPLTIMGYLASSPAVSIRLFVIPVFVSDFFLGPSLALVQGLALLRMRSIASAMKMLCLNLVGLGLGPTLVGFLSDMMMPRYGVDSLRYALVAVSLFQIWAAVHFYLCGRNLAEGLERARKE